MGIPTQTDPPHIPDSTAPASEGEPTSSTHSPSAQAEEEPKPWICRPRVRLGIYTFLFLFVLFTIGWGLIPRLLDPTFEQHIQEKQVMVGMTRDQVLQAWGSPLQSNVTYTNEGIRREEWIYEEWKSASDIRHRYLYFEEGILIGGWH